MLDVIRAKRAVPILMYHQVSHRVKPAFQKYTVSVREFALQVAWMALAGYTTITFETLIAYSQGLGTLPSRPIILTFDDGYAECVEHATRLLSARKFTAYFFLVTSLVGKNSEWLPDNQAKSLKLLDWDDALALEAQGFHCGAHSMTHPYLSRLDEDDCYAELSQSRELLERRLNHPINHLSYPYGSYNESVCNMARTIGYLTACTTEPGLAKLDNDSWLMLHRVPIIGGDTFVSFLSKLNTGHAVHKLLAKERQLLLFKQRESGR